MKTKENKIKIYVAGPLGFSEAGKLFMYEKLVPAIEELGYEVIDPWKEAPLREIKRVLKMPYGIKRKKAWKKVDFEIGKRNEESIREANGLVAVLDGADVDSGTGSEIGGGYFLNKPILGYRGDFRLSSENEGAIVNIQVEYFIRASGGTIVNNIPDLKKEAKKLFG